MLLLLIERYDEQVGRWPEAGRHILAQYDDATIVVYQAYRDSIADWCITHQRLGGPEFSFSRMSWIKPNFLWMMFRSGWGTKENQEAVIALRFRRSFFDEVLTAAVPSTADLSRYADQAEWSAALKTSEVRLQWDPDHDPTGAPIARRAIQLGLRGEYLARMAKPPDLVEIVDTRSLVVEQRVVLQSGRLSELAIPRELVYPLARQIGVQIGIDEEPPTSL